jgi:hypothetical protein
VVIATDNGDTLDLEGIQWSSDDNAVATVGGAGGVAANALGETVVTASLASFVDSVVVQVLPTATATVVVELDPAVASAATFVDVVASAYGASAPGDALRIPDDADSPGLVAALLSGESTAEWLVSVLVPLRLFQLDSPRDLISLIRAAADYAALVSAVESAAQVGRSFVDDDATLSLAERFAIDVLAEVAPAAALASSSSPVRGVRSTIVIEDESDVDTDMAFVRRVTHSFVPPRST